MIWARQPTEVRCALRSRTCGQVLRAPPCRTLPRASPYPISPRALRRSPAHWPVSHRCCASRRPTGQALRRRHRRRARPSTGLRQAIQGGIATAFAVVAGELVSPQRWYWAAFAAFAMFQGTRSRGESIAKEIQFLIGTLAGVFAGVLIAAALNGHELLTMAAIVGALFLAWQAFPAAYGVMVFWITIILGLMFGMLGYFPTE